MAALVKQLDPEDYDINEKDRSIAMTEIGTAHVEQLLGQPLRDPDRLKGKCGACEYRRVCGGSRARAYAITGDYLESEPYCAYVPPAWEKRGTTFG